MLIVKVLGSYRADVINYFMVLQVMKKGRESGHSALRVTNSQKEKRRKGGEKKRLCSRRWGRKRTGSHALQGVK